MSEALKVGQVHPESGLVYLGKQKHCKDGMRWCTPEKYKERRAAISNWAKSEEAKNRSKKARNTDANRAKRNSYAKVWGKSPERRAKAAAYARQKRKDDGMYCLRERVRARVSEAIRKSGYGGRSQTNILIGCDWQTLERHLESKFSNGMSWENRSKWHVDHIIPLASANTKDELLRLFHFTNLQPLWASENQRKGAKLESAVYCRRAIQDIDANDTKSDRSGN